MSGTLPTQRSPTLARQSRSRKIPRPERRRGLAKGDWLSDVSFGLLAGLEPLEIAANAYGKRLGFFPGGVDPRNVTATNAVEHFGFFDEPRGERYILAV